MSVERILIKILIKKVRLIEKKIFRHLFNGDVSDFF